MEESAFRSMLRLWDNVITFGFRAKKFLDGTLSWSPAWALARNATVGQSSLTH